ncbi:RlmE family RNA methyltransferase [Paracoccus endophyticus]|uniref:RlmE family RNA methyltransferase n=1 Tax=Paracoccus endophyticus TaxID=2233774 RepID=UPI000DD80A73|nr:RlmE family RNA methyltransferase [Paracoccus endophyticus]
MADGGKGSGAGGGGAGSRAGKASSGRGQRDLRVRVKTAKGRKLSSTLWLERQLNDPYVVRAKREGYRGRAAYKILELDDRYGFLRPGARVVDLGCAPGGWCQVAVDRVNALGERSGKPRGTVLGVDLQAVDPIPGAEIHQLDFLEDDADARVKGWLGGRADVVMSDMAASASGHKGTDHLRIVALVEAAAQFAFDVLEPGGTFVAKVLAGGAERGLQATLKQNFAKVANVKPPASRSDSSEKFVVATGFRGPSQGSAQDPAEADWPDGEGDGPQDPARPGQDGAAEP